MWYPGFGVRADEVSKALVPNTVSGEAVCGRPVYPRRKGEFERLNQSASPKMAVAEDNTARGHMVALPFVTVGMAPWKGALCPARTLSYSSPAPRPKHQMHTLLRAWSVGLSALTF